MRSRHNSAVYRAGFAAVALAVSGATPTLFGSTHTWLGGANSWGFIAANSADAVWTGAGGGLNVPPNSITTEVFIGNNGSVNLGGGAWQEGYLHIGQSGPDLPGAATLVIDDGSMTTAQNVYVGDGNVGSLIINGGQLIGNATGKRFYLGGGTLGSANAYLEINAGTLQFTSKYGIEKWTTSPGTSTINMTGGVINLTASDNQNQVIADHMIFSGGWINNTSRVTIHELSGAGSITMRSNATLPGITLDLAADSSFDGKIASPGAPGSGAAGTITKLGNSVLTLGPNAVLMVRTAYKIDGGTIKLGNNEQLGPGAGTVTLSDGTISIGAAGVLDLNGFTQSCKVLTGSGELKLGNGGVLQANISGTGTPPSATFDGLISGNGSISKGFSGQWILTGANTHTGSTTITNGSLQINNANALQYSETNVNATNSLAFGSGIGTFTLGGLAGGGSLGAASESLQDVSAAPVTLRVGNNNAAATFNGMLTGSGNLMKIGTGTQTLSEQGGSASTYTGQTIVQSGTLVLGLNVHGPVLTEATSPDNADVKGGRLVFDYNGGSTVAAQVLSILDAGAALGTPFSNGAIFTSNTPDIGKALAWKDDATAMQVTVAYTYKGDTNLDGQVTISDLGELASNWQSTTAVWSQGDFNYDGSVTIGDLGDLASNWQAGVGNPLGMSFQEALAAVGLSAMSVPEPATISAAMLISVALTSRRRRA